MLQCQVYDMAPASFVLPNIDHYCGKDTNLDTKCISLLAGTLPSMSPNRKTVIYMWSLHTLPLYL